MSCLKKIAVSFISLTLCLSIVLNNVQAQGLSPINLSQMYNLASNGNISALKNAVNRGLKIDAQDRNGNTGLCHAILQRNYTAYNTFRAAGANPRHSCTQGIPAERYESFMNSRNVIPVGERVREINTGYESGEYAFSKTTWILGGLVATGVAALFIFGSSGGGGGNKGIIGETVDGEESIAKYIGTKTPKQTQSGYYGSTMKKAGSGQIVVNQKNYDNDDNIEIRNDSSVYIKDTKTLSRLAELINFNDYMLNYSEYVQAFMKAVNGGVVQNGDDTSPANEPYVNIGNAVAGLTAYNGSTAVNYGVLHIRAQNGAFGLVGGKDSMIVNRGRINISLTDATSVADVFSDPLTTTNNQISAMYVDTRSTAINYGLIDGVSTINGRVFGMQGRIINQEDYPVSTDPMMLTNAASGVIQLKVTAEGGISLNTNMIGMGSYVDKTFLDAKYRLSRAAYTELVNDGEIEMILNVVNQPYDDQNEYTATVISGNEGIVGMRADVNTTAVNNGTIKIDLSYATDVEGAHAGMIAVRGGELQNYGTIDIVEGLGGYGMLGVRGTGINAEIDLRHPYLYNYGTININSKGGYGMASLFGGVVLNDKDAFINVNSQGTGMYVNLEYAINNGEINVGSSSVGMDTAKGTVINSGTGEINASGTGSIAMRTTEGQAKNEGEINVSGGAIAMEAASSGGSVTNDGIINISTGSTGLAAANGGTATNNKELTLTAMDSVAMEDLGGGYIVNSSTGEITLESAATNSYAMKVDSGEGTNDGKISVESDTSYGMYSTSGKITNSSSGTISVSGNGSTAMETDTGTAYNYGEIEVSSLNGYGIKVASGSGTNYGKVSLLNSGAYGMYTDSGTLANQGTISSTLSGVYGIYTISGTGTNNSVISLTGAKSIGMYTVSGDIKNNSSITVSNGIGMNVNGTGSATNETTGLITVGSGGKGMNNDGSGTLTNNGSISSTLSGAYGIYAGSGTGINNSAISLTGTNSIGMYATSGSIKNSGSINVSDGVGMSVFGSGSAVNSKSIIVTNGTGISVNGSGSAVNEATATITVNSGTGMSAINGGAITNLGTIKVTSGNGMYASGSGSSITNSGIITVAGSSLTSSTTCDPDTGCGNFIVVTDSATFTNNSLVRSAFSLNFSEMTDETSKVLIGKDGTYEAPSLEGTVYASSDIVEEGFETVYTNENAFVGEDNGIELVSNSALFDAYLEKNEDGAYSVVMTMKAFDEVVSVGTESSASVAGFLQANYDNGLGIQLMSSLKSASSLGILNSEIISALGLDTIPNFAKQNLDIIKSLDAKINETLFSAEPEEERILVGYDYYDRKQGNLGVFTGYKDKSHSAYTIADKRYNEMFRYGVGLAITDYRSDYDNDAKRKETIVQLLAPVTVDFGETVTLLSIPRIGYGFGDYTRKHNSTKYKADTSNYYYGVTNELRKSFDLGMLILEPTAEFNVLNLYQDSTKEKQGIRVNSSNNLSTEAGLGLYVKKEFSLTEIDKVKFRMGGTFYHEFSNSYQGAKATLHGMGGSYHMESYDTQRNRGVLSMRADYQRRMLNFYVQLNQYLEDKSAYSFNVGVGYRF